MTGRGNGEDEQGKGKKGRSKWIGEVPEYRGEEVERVMKEGEEAEKPSKGRKRRMKGEKRKDVQRCTKQFSMKRHSITL